MSHVFLASQRKVDINSKKCACCIRDKIAVMSSQDYPQITAATTDAMFIANDAEMLRAEQLYQDFENTLAKQLANIEQDHPGYHAYYYNVDSIGHNPYVLIAILSAVKPDFHVDDPDIQQMFTELKRPRRQYTLTVNQAIADEYADRFAGVDIERIEPKYLDLHVKFTNYELYCVVDSVLSHKQLCAYAGYIRNNGGRPDLFPADQYPHAVHITLPTTYHVAESLRAKYPALDAELQVGEQYIGYPYVWSGHAPDTSFDCSGFVGYILDQLGLKYRNKINDQLVHLPVAGSTRNGAYYDGLYDKCAPVDSDERQPGDLVFFTGTFDASYRSVNLSHVGIYVGDDMFLACSAPLGVRYQSYDDLDERGRPWRNLLYGYGRITEPSQQFHEEAN